MSDFAIHPHASPVAADLRATMLEDPGFGRVFTDHMVVVDWTEGQGWHDARITARAPLSLDPACAVLHYAQEIFEGLKAYRAADGDIVMFRPEANARRFNLSAERMAMPAVPEETFLAGLQALIRADRDWVPEGEGSLYLRPFMFGSETFLGVRPSAEYMFIIIASSVGGYFKGGKPGITVWVSEDYTRAARGGTGAAKCGGNYAASLVAQKEAIGHGCDQVVFLDAVERKWVEELGGMNTFFVMDDGSLVTPPLGGTILPGITRDSLITLARDQGLTVREEPYAMDQWQADARSGRLREAFACGTAAVITPIVEVKGETHNFIVGNGGPGLETTRLREALTAIQRGTAPDPYGWVTRIA